MSMSSAVMVARPEPSSVTVTSCPRAMGELLSSTVTVAVVVVALPQSSVAVNVTVAEPVFPQRSERLVKSFVQVVFPQRSAAAAPP